MSKKTFAPLIRDKRKALGLTQRQLAQQLGVKPSHVAYLEHGLRKPSLALLRRIAEKLDLDPQELFLLSRPEAKYLIKLSSKSDLPKKPDESWLQFARNRTLLNQHHVTRDELKVLRQVSLLRGVSSPRQFLFILNSIRQASEEE
jgi:transcriptional regulator with XRE-family HTH domain